MNPFQKGLELLIDIVMELSKSKCKNTIEMAQIKEQLSHFLEKKCKQNWVCSLEEEIDFEGLAGYICNDLLQDMEERLFAETSEQRNYARQRILQKSIEYAQAHTHLSKNRVNRIVTSVMNLIRDFYWHKIPKDSKLLVASAIDENNKITHEEGEKTREAIRQSSVLSIENNIALLKKGQVDEFEERVNSMFQSIGTAHPLYPDYTYVLQNIDGRIEAHSTPLSVDAENKYKPRLEIGVTATLDGNELYKFDSTTFNYAFKHQHPIILNVVEAKKFLGSIPDPVQHEAQREIGKQYVLHPPEFPPAFPCALYGDDNVIIEYMLLRTHEILDDGTYIITNEEEQNRYLKIEAQLNIEKNQFTINIKPMFLNNKSRLLISEITQKISISTGYRLYSLAARENLVTGKSPAAPPKSLLANVDQDIEFYKKLLEIEKYIGEEFILPDAMSDDDMQVIDGLADLVRGKKWKHSWSDFVAQFNITASLKQCAEEPMADHEFCLLFQRCTLCVTLWNQTIEFVVARTYPYVVIRDWDRVCSKIKILDEGDPINLTLGPGKSGHIMWDELVTNNR